MIISGFKNRIIRYTHVIHSKINYCRFVVANVSPAVVVPSMIDLEERRLGTGKNIPSLAIASSCLDNILAITGHSLMIGIVFNKGFYLCKNFCFWIKFIYFIRFKEHYGGLYCNVRCKF